MPRIYLRVWIVLLMAAGSAAAQKPAESVLPDAPLPAGSANSESLAPATRIESRQMRPSFATSLTAREKFALAYHRIVSPQMPLKAVFVSGFELAAGTGPDFATNGWGPFGKRVGYNALSISTTTFFTTGFVPALAHQDPRYFPLGEGSAGSRLTWAIRSEFVGFGDDGHTMPNYANVVGLGLSAIVADTYLPGASTGAKDVFKAYSIKLGIGAGMNVAREFGAFDRLKALAHHSKATRD